MNTQSCRLALALPGPAEHPLSADIIRKTFTALDITVLLAPAAIAGFSADDSSLMAEAQQRGIACLLSGASPDDRPDGHDGILFGPEVSGSDLKHARQQLGNDVMIGAEATSNRDDAMQKGEAGIDVLTFSFDGSPEKLGPLCEIISWWADIFILPCLVSGNIGIGAAGALIKSGADFLAPVEPVWGAPSEPDAVLREYEQLISGNRPL